MKSIKFFLLPLLAFVFAFSSCKSLCVNQKEDLYLIVFDENSFPIEKANIFIDGKQICQTDLNGRASVLENIYSGEHEILIKKDGFEDFFQKDFFVPGSILFFTLNSWKNYFSKAETFLEKNDFDSSIFYARKALALKNRDETEYLLSIALAKGGYKKESEEILESLLKDEKYGFIKKDKEVGYEK